MKDSPINKSAVGMDREHVSVSIDKVNDYLHKVVPRMVDETMDHETMKLYLKLSESGLVYNKQMRD